jgi:hypothetical protein
VGFETNPANALKESWEKASQEKWLRRGRGFDMGKLRIKAAQEPQAVKGLVACSPALPG